VDFMTALPINDLYHVPIEKISFLECSDGGVAQGGQNVFALAEGDSPGEARISLRVLPGFADNYNDLPVEKRRGLAPFRFRDGEIVKVLECDKRFRSRDGSYTCGMPVHDIDGHPDQNDEMVNINGEFGGCCLERYDIPEGFDCPYEEDPDALYPR
jgi:hypothetical protein